MPLVVPKMSQSVPEISTGMIMVSSLLLRVAFLLFGKYQDTYMDLPYTDIDYFVFTDASKFVFHGQSPFLRDTYRYTPVLAWLLLPINYWFDFGKLLFVVCDLVTGYLIIRLLQKYRKSVNWSLLWLWNPIVATISTRGSSESILTVVVMLLTYSVLNRQYALAGIITGLAVHLKIYPIIYIPAILLSIDPSQPFYQPFTKKRWIFVLTTLLGFTSLTGLMYYVYGDEFLQEAYFYHLTRLDHRHNFSVYNLTLYLSSYKGSSSLPFLQQHGLRIERLAFLPQLGLSMVLIPLKLATVNLIGCFFIQTFVFIMFNKVITSQYFIWFMCFLPIYTANSTIKPTRAAWLIGAWVISQGLWLWNGYQLEFLGKPDIFTNGIWSSSCLFFVCNSILAVNFINDMATQKQALVSKKDS
ncbi:hypothetical protein OGAPHI_004823 [Ogataea philodendri]|uniref:GPI mannosyltransferase 1 n=1 Tax=Ogataea philodendri TaxID=1378263 RepID=A0A9P8P3Q6_9ASCO|nr:uncharacterized protein OGAPHI_004823 [Ogataea philodendri]KAH3664109.1 hypothetical protein OGAPHI_004823 [Ogataea philodendri]